jgi:hypothetical protein
MAECWAMDLPIITNAGIGDNDRYFKDHRGGVLVNAFNTEEYRKAAKAYLQLNATPGSYRRIALENFDNRMAIQNYTEVYRRICK